MFLSIHCEPCLKHGATDRLVTCGLLHAVAKDRLHTVTGWYAWYEKKGMQQQQQQQQRVRISKCCTRQHLLEGAILPTAGAAA